MLAWLFLLGCLVPSGPSLVFGQSNEKKSKSAAKSSSKSTETLVAKLKKSLVTVKTTDRDGQLLGIGTGFVIDANGLIATNFHVIGEGRPIQLELWPNIPLTVQAIQASSRTKDLAILRVKLPAEPLIPLPLADGSIVDQGTEVLALGNPLGFRQSVVKGLVSGIREIDGQELIQMAIPIEPGNSGGPLVDLKGKVHGIINMKSAVARNVGFAIPVVRLRELFENPNPIVMEKWVRLSGVDPDKWQVVMGGDWRERSSILQVTSNGLGFGGRSLCLNQTVIPNGDFEVAVEVKLSDESGAAGLVFYADGQDRHYGFYPTNGKLRLTCFRGADVTSWEILREVSSPYYRPGQWNHLRVRVKESEISCFVNDQLVIKEKHRAFRSGLAGVAAYRGTLAEFRRFELAEGEIAHPSLSEASKAFLESVLASNGNVQPLLTEPSLPDLQTQGPLLARELNREADRLHEKAQELRRWSEDARLAPILVQLAQLLADESPDDLLEGALLIAALDHPDLDIPAYVARVAKMADEISSGLSKDAPAERKLDALNRYLFIENGFHGGLEEYYHPANNHLDRVIDDREGMPITLSLLYIDLGRRLGLKIEGVGLPGHYVVRFRESRSESMIIDVFNKASVLDDEAVASMVLASRNRLPTDEELRSQPTLAILQRILSNLVEVSRQSSDFESLYRYTGGYLALDSEAIEMRLLHGMASHQTNRFEMALSDLDWLFERDLPGLDMEQLSRSRKELRERLKK
jgi:serine protease Do